MLPLGLVCQQDLEDSPNLRLERLKTGVIEHYNISRFFKMPLLRTKLESLPFKQSACLCTLTPETIQDGQLQAVYSHSCSAELTMARVILVEA